MKVSVIVPVYNCEAYLPQCIATLRAQTLEEIELIFVDDASTDGSLSLLRAAQAEDAPRIKYLKAILSAVESFGVISKVDALDVSNSANAQFRYDGRFTVKLGKNEYIDNKMQILLGAVSELGSEETGIIDISEEKRAHFNPDE